MFVMENWVFKLKMKVNRMFGIILQRIRCRKWVIYCVENLKVD